MVSISHCVSRSMAAGFIFIFCASAWSAAAKEIRLKDLPLELKEGDRLVVSALRAQIRLQPLPPGNSSPVLRMRKVLGNPERAQAGGMDRFEALTVATRRDGSTVYVEGKGPMTQTDLAEWLKPQGSPELILEIDAPSVSAEIALREGSVTVQNWRQALSVSLVDGAVKASGTEGTMRLQVQKGSVAIDTHRGTVEVDSYGAKVNAQNIDGDLRLVNFGGESVLKQIKGNVDVSSSAGATSLAKATGNLEFDLGRGALSVSEFDGAIRGQTELGTVSVGVLGEADVQIDSNQGTVSVQLPPGSGALVRLQSDEGSITVPEAIRPGTNGSMKVANGRMGGSGSKGSVTIKSKTGSIRVR